MSATYNLKLENDYKEFFDMVIEDIDDTNPVDGQGFPLDDHDEPITVDYLWEEFGQYLDGTQSGLGYQVFNEVIEHYKNIDNQPISEERKKEIIEMAEGDWMDDYRVGQIKTLTRNDVDVFGLTGKELTVYIDAYNNMNA